MACHLSRQQLFDDQSGRDVLAGTSVTLVIQYVEPADGRSGVRLQRWAQLRCHDVSDFSLFEQEGANSGSIEALQAEWYRGRMRLWFDQDGEVYVVCGQAEFKEVALPPPVAGERPVREWVFQAREGALPSVEWLLAELDRRAIPCRWVHGEEPDSAEAGCVWSGALVRGTDRASADTTGLLVRGYGPRDGVAFGLSARTQGEDHEAVALMGALRRLIAERFEGDDIGLERIGGL